MKNLNFYKLLTQINELKLYCGNVNQNADGDKSSVDTKKAYKILKTIIKSTDPNLIQELNFSIIDTLFNCCFLLTVNSTSTMKIHSRQNLSKQSVMKLRKRLSELLSILISAKFDDVLNIYMNRLRIGNFNDSFVTEILKSLWSCQFQCETILDNFLKLIEELMIENKIVAANVVAIGLARSIDESLRDFKADGLNKLLRLYHLSVEITSPSKLIHLKDAFEYSLIRFVNVMSVDELTKLLPTFLDLTFKTDFSTKSELNEFASTLNYAFVRMSTNKIYENFKPETVEYLLASVALDCKTKSLLACRYLSHLLDHFDNFDEISLPKIFYYDTRYKLNVAKHESAVKFIENYRQLIQSSFLSAIKLHGCISSNLFAIFKVICMMIVSVPSTSTFIMVITLLMDVQTCVLDADAANLTTNHKNHIHAFIISIMTLICWVLRNKALKKYIHEIVRLRFCHAPHLNPPVKSFYVYEEHHVLGFKEELFLDKWEIRYCLWNEEKTENMSEITNITGSSSVDRTKDSKMRALARNLFRPKSDKSFKESF